MLGGGLMALKCGLCGGREAEFSENKACEGAAMLLSLRRLLEECFQAVLLILDK